MRTLVVGASGAVGQVVVATLRGWGHHVTPTSRRPRDGMLTLDPQRPAAVAHAARGHDVVVDAAGIEDPRVWADRAGTVLVEISASGRYLDALAAGDTTGGVVLGAGLAPGLSTLLVAALDTRPGDRVDVGVMLGSGERHGPAAVTWTGNLAGTEVYRPPEPHPIANLHEVRRLPHGVRSRRHLRADFPDHLLVGLDRGIDVRSYLALDSRWATAALAVVGRAPALAPLLARAPHVGTDRWTLTARRRRGDRTIHAHGAGQSRASGRLTALAAVAAASDPPRRPVAAHELLDLGDVADLAEIELAGDLTSTTDAAAGRPAHHRQAPSTPEDP